MKSTAILLSIVLLTGVLLVPVGTFAQDSGSESVQIKDQVSVNVNQANTNSTAESIPLEDQVNVTNATETMSEQGLVSEQEVSKLVHEAVLLFKQQRDETINAIKECRENIQNAPPENKQQVRGDCRSNLNEIKDFYKEMRNQIRELFQEQRDTVKMLIKEAKTSLAENSMATHVESDQEDTNESDQEDHKK